MLQFGIGWCVGNFGARDGRATPFAPRRAGPPFFSMRVRTLNPHACALCLRECALFLRESALALAVASG